jgi:hypothetical protein
MKRFLAVLAIAAVASFVYVAAAPGSQLAAPTAKQFGALKRQVAAISTKVKAQAATINGLKSQVAAQATTIVTLKGQLSALQTDESAVKSIANTDDAFLKNCLVAGGVFGVSQFGDPNGSFGYAYHDSTGDFLTSALDVDSSSPGAYFQAVAPSCVSSGSAAPKLGQVTEGRGSSLTAKSH